MAELNTADALRLFEICNKAAMRARVDDEDDRHDFALQAFENFFSKERIAIGKDRSEYMWAFAQATISGLIKDKRRREMKLLRESACVNEDGENYFDLMLPFTRGTQENHVDALFWAERIEELPEYHRDTLSVLADGGSPLDLCLNGARPVDVLKAASWARSSVQENGARKQLERARWGSGPECVECSSHSVDWDSRGKYVCADCRVQFDVVSKTPLAPFLSPYSKTLDEKRLPRPYRSLCEIAEMMRDGAGPTQIEARFGVPYMLAFDVHSAALATPWFAVMAGREHCPIVREPKPRKLKPPKRRKAKPPVARREQKPANLEFVTRFGPWEPEEIDTLANRWEAGKSALQIAKELGRSRNSVLGKIHRHGLIQLERAA